MKLRGRKDNKEETLYPSSAELDNQRGGERGGEWDCKNNNESMICTIKMKCEGHEKYIGRWGMGERDREKAFEICVNLDSYTTFRLLGSHWIQLCPHWVVDICLTVYLLCLLFPASTLMRKFPTQITFITSGARVLIARVTSVRKNSLRSMA